jgi:hypothetical protein
MRFRLLYDIVNLALWKEPFTGILLNLFDELAQIIERTIYLNANEKGHFKKYSTKTISRLLLGTIFGTIIRLMLQPDEKLNSELLNSIQLLYQP